MFITENSVSKVSNVDLIGANYCRKCIRYRTNLLEKIMKTFPQEDVGLQIQQQRQTHQYLNEKLGRRKDYYKNLMFENCYSSN
ncbi:hypothetical protein CEXT_476181 [Caerostris extrusa]|uniref:Uncharacterized protein n=1 Tax=Caerostris extrusa TaxID=172846 RepID=A0AAV4W9G5_CAEEX|nr:hypothetical protein CEXT_476181 [Caerostris extrusa]